MIMSISTKSFSYIGVYTIVIHGDVKDIRPGKGFLLSISIENTFILTISREPPTITVTAAPIFLRKLEDQ
jgi:hypothetical protein